MIATARTAPPTSRRRDHFFELGKFKIIELWLGFWVGVALLSRSAIRMAAAWPSWRASLVAGIAVVAANCSLDDIVGVRDGVDQANHREGTRWESTSRSSRAASMSPAPFASVHPAGRRRRVGLCRRPGAGRRCRPGCGRR